jgi:predicted dehydrogenase
METIRIGLIGAGAVAQARHLPKLKAIAGVELAMVWNRTLDKAEGVAEEFGFERAVADWHEIAESPDIDAVVIATPPGTHHEMTLASLAGGKHVLCQARMSRNLKEAQEMRDAAKASGKVTCLYPPQPGLKGDRTMLRLLNDEDYVGEIREVRMVGMAAPSGSGAYHWRQDPDINGIHMLTMGMWVEVLNRWVGPATSLVAKSQHHTKQVNNLSGELIDAAVPDSLAIAADLECGASATYHFSTEASFAGAHKIEIYGSKGALVYTLFGDTIEGATVGMESMQPIEPDPDEIRDQTTDAEFIQAIREGTPVHPSFDEGVQYMEFCEAVGQSVYFNKVVDLPPDPLMATWGRTL